MEVLPVVPLACGYRSTYQDNMANDSEIPAEGQTAAPAAQNAEFMKEFERTIAAYGQAIEAGNVQAAEGAAIQALMLAGAEALRNPTPALQLKQEAGECESRRDWAGAEAAYRKVLVLEEASGILGPIAKAQMDLARLLRRVGRLDEAWQFAQAATGSARRANVFPVLVMALEGEVACALAKGENQTALAAASEAVQVIEPGKIYNSMRARAWVTRARCRLANGDSAGAESDLAASWELMPATTVFRSMPGPLVLLGSWWEVKGLVLERQGDLPSAREAITKAIEYRRRLEDPYAAFALKEALERLGELAKKTGDLAGCEGALAEADSLRSNLRLPLR